MYETKLYLLQPVSLADQLAEAKEQLSSALQQLGKKRYFLQSAKFCYLITHFLIV